MCYTLHVKRNTIQSVGARHACQVTRGVKYAREELLKWYLITYSAYLNRKTWGMMQQLYKTSVNKVSKLCQQLAEVSTGLQQNIVGSAVDECMKRLQACVTFRTFTINYRNCP